MFLSFYIVPRQGESAARCFISQFKISKFLGIKLMLYIKILNNRLSVAMALGQRITGKNQSGFQELKVSGLNHPASLAMVMTVRYRVISAATA